MALALPPLSSLTRPFFRLEDLTGSDKMADRTTPAVPTAAAQRRKHAPRGRRLAPVTPAGRAPGRFSGVEVEADPGVLRGLAVQERGCSADRLEGSACV